MVDPTAPLGSAIVELRTGRIVKLLSGFERSSSLEVLELMGAVAVDVLGKHHSSALSALFARLGEATSADTAQEQFREVMVLSEDRAFVVQRVPRLHTHALVSVLPADRRLGLLISAARQHLTLAETALLEEGAS